MDLFGRDPIPRERRDEAADLTAEFEGLYTADGTRLRRYTDYRKENEAGREGMPPGETVDYGQRQGNDGAVQRPRISFPLGRGVHGLPEGERGGTRGGAPGRDLRLRPAAAQRRCGPAPSDSSPARQGPDR